MTGKSTIYKTTLRGKSPEIDNYPKGKRQPAGGRVIIVYKKGLFGGQKEMSKEFIHILAQQCFFATCNFKTPSDEWKLELIISQSKT